MIIGLQIIAVFFALVMVYFAILNYRRCEINKTELLAWCFIWIFVIVVAIFPEMLREFSQAFLITRLFDLLVIGGFILVIALTASTYVRSKKMEKKLEDYIRKDALNDVKKESKKK
jgi:hypothetical protein